MVLKNMKTAAAIALSLIAVGILGYRFGAPLVDFFDALPPDDVETKFSTISGPLVAANKDAVLPSLSSPREEAERKLYAGLLHELKADVLVVPLAAPQAASLDPAARSMITQRIAYAIMDRTDLKVAEPGLVARALGINRRIYPPAEVEALARQLDAKVIIAGEVIRPVPAAGFKRFESGELSYKLVFRVSGTAIGAQLKTVEWPDIEFGDALPPEEAVRDHITQRLDELIGGGVKPSVSAAAVIPDAKLPQRAFDLTLGAGSSSLEEALKLQLFAAFCPRNDIHGRLLWERSLITLDAVPVDLPFAKLLRARANFHLGRRPYALTFVGSPQNAAESALFQILQGNLPEAAQATGDVQEPALRLVAEIELEDLRNDYRKNEGQEDRRKAILQKWPDYASLVYLRFSDRDWFSWELHEYLLQSLSNLDAQIRLPSSTLEVWLQYLKYLFHAVAEGTTDDFTIPFAIEAAREPLWKDKAKVWSMASNGRRLVPMDYFELLFINNREAAFKVPYNRATAQSLPKEGLATLKQLEAGFPVDAAFANLKAHLQWKLAGNEGNEQTPTPERERAWRTARDAYLWEGAETSHSEWSESLLWRKKYLKYLDDPPYAGRTWLDPNANRFTLTTAMPADELERRLAWEKRRLAFVQTTFSAVETAERYMRDTGQVNKIDDLRRIAQSRFHGSENRSKFLTTVASRVGDPAEEERTLRAALAANPRDWEHYRRLGDFLIQQQKPEDAQKLYFDYPQFKEVGDEPLETGNHAGDAAAALFHSGASTLAKPLYKLCYGIDTGSSRQIESGEMLALIAGDVKSAARFAEMNYRRYPDGNTAFMAIQMMMLAGRSEEAWTLFQSASRQFEKAEVLWGAVIGHQLKNSTDQEIFEFANQWGLDPERTAKGGHYEGIFRDHLVFMAMFLDREPSDEAMALLKKINSRHGDGTYLDVGAAYQAFQRRDYAGVIKSWTTLSSNLSNVSMRTGNNLNYPLPYIALAHHATNRWSDYQQTAARYGARFPESFEYTLTDAVTRAMQGKHGAAENVFWKAFFTRPGTDIRPIFASMMLLDMLEAVFEQTKHDGYRKLIIEFSRRLQRTSQISYAYAYEAKYTDNPADRVRALASSLLLDKRSAHIAGFKETAKAEARAWTEKHGSMPVAASE